MSEMKNNNSGKAQLVKDSRIKSTGSCISKILLILLIVIAIAAGILLALNITTNNYYGILTEDFDGLTEGKFDVNKATVNKDISSTIAAGINTDGTVVKITTDKDGKQVYETIPFSEIEKDVKANYQVASQNLISDPDIYNYVFMGNDSYNNKATSTTGTVSTDVIIILSYNEKSQRTIYYTLDANSFVYVSSIDKVTTLADTYAIGGAMMVCKTIQENYSVALNGFIDMGIDSCAKSIDEFGEIRLKNVDVAKLNSSIDAFNEKFGADAKHVTADAEGYVKLNGIQSAAYLQGYDRNSRFETTQEVIKATLIASLSKGAFGVKSFADNLASNIDMGTSKDDFKVLCDSILKSPKSLSEKFVNAVNASHPRVWFNSNGLNHTVDWLDNASIRERLVEIIYI